MKWLLIAGVALAALTGAGIGAYVLYVEHEGADVRGSSTVEFLPTQAPKPPPPPARPQGIVWPTFGFDAERQRVSPPFSLVPPYRLVWTFHGRALLEFPPVVAYDRLYLTTFDGRFYALSSRTGKPVWHYFSHRCGWASPAVAQGLVYQTFIGHACAARRPGSDGSSPAAASTSGTGTAGSGHSMPAPARRAGPTARAARSRARPRSPAAPSSSARTTATSTP